MISHPWLPSCVPSSWVRILPAVLVNMTEIGVYLASALVALLEFPILMNPRTNLVNAPRWLVLSYLAAYVHWWHTVWPDWAIYWTLGNFLKPLATNLLSKSSTFLGNFCKDVEIYHFSSEIIFKQLLKTFGDFFLVTLHARHSPLPNLQ